MPAEMEFCLLGPLLVRRGGAVVPVSRGKQRAVLATLLLNANRIVSVDELAEILWGPDLPASARVTVQNYVKRLRHVLGDADRARIRTTSGGYQIHASACELDVSAFEALAESARTAGRNEAWGQASESARQALALWRGEPLADAGSSVLAEREAPRLAEIRLQLLETRLDAGLHLGGHAEAVPELQRLVRIYPLRERLHAMLMLALYQCGGPAEALTAYQAARRVLADEVGAEPGAELRELYQRILAADPALAAEPASRSGPRQSLAPGRDLVTPRQLPPAVGHFTGREPELAALNAMLDKPDGRSPGTIVISAIEGTAGVGKTALAVHWAHQVAERFPDGQLYVNLRGYDPGQPVPAADALAGFLRSLGVPGQDIPPETEECAARYRSLLAGKRMLVVLDNAGSADQVRPLLPGTPACTVVVTSRDALAGLAARDGAARLDLDVLPLEEAVALLRTLIGIRVDADTAAAAELASQCCRLPLALRVAADLAASRPGMPLAALTSELADLRTRLDLLEAGGDPHTQVRAVFSWSCRHLDPDAARAFRLLGLHPGPGFDSYAVAALTAATLPQARRALDVLAGAHLIQHVSARRYGMHDLLRGYARELTITPDTGEDRHAALTRLLDYYLHAAAAAMDTLFPAQCHRRPRIPRAATPVPPLADPAAARQWLDSERAVLVAAAAHTSGPDWPGHATRLAATLSRYLLSGDHLSEALTIFSHALAAARRMGDLAAEAMTVNGIGDIDWQQGRLQQAADHYLRAHALFRAAGDRAGEARALGNIGLSETELGRYEQAARQQQKALAIFRDIDDQLGEAHALGSLGLVRQRQGRYREAADNHWRSLELFREIGDREGEAYALGRLGAVDLLVGRYQDAAGYLQQALALSREIGSTVAGSAILGKLGEAYLGLGRYEQAAENFEQALAWFREVGNRGMQTGALNGLGDVLSQTGETGKARAYHATALQLASEVGSPREQARAHSGLARAYQDDRDSRQAQHHWQEALTRYAAIGAPEAREIRVRLATARPGGDNGHEPTPEDRSTTTPAGRHAAALPPRRLASSAPGSEQSRWPGGDRLGERLDLGHPGSHRVVEPACELERVDVVGGMDEDGGGAPLPQPAGDRVEPVLPSRDRTCRVVPADVADDGIAGQSP
jgi:DNA-binding SARP family transcriptional activator